MFSYHNLQKKYAASFVTSSLGSDTPRSKFYVLTAGIYVNMGKSAFINPFLLLLNNVMLILVHLRSCPSSSNNNTCFWLGDYCPNSTWSYSAKDQDSEPPSPDSRPNTPSTLVVGLTLGFRGRHVKSSPSPTVHWNLGKRSPVTFSGIGEDWTA